MPISLGTKSYIHEKDYKNTFQGNVTIGNYTSIAKGVTFLSGRGVRHTSQENPNYVSNFPFIEDMRIYDIKIGSDVWIGTEVIILDDVQIGDGAIIGAGCVVSKDVPPYAVVAGNPQKILKYRFTEEQVKKLLAIRWWHWSESMIKESLPLFHHIDDFIAKFYGS